MADPLSISASVLAVITAAVQASKSLYATVERYKGRDKVLNRLQREIGDLTTILASLSSVVQTEAMILKLLEGPVRRCSQLCREFEFAMDKFTGKSKLGLMDWARMEFMRGDINEFMDTLSDYKATISVGLGTITMQTSKLNQQVLEDYNEMIKDTKYSLELHLQRIDEKLAHVTSDDEESPKAGIELHDEKEVTKQCLRICEDARSYIETLKERQPAPSQGGGSKSSGIAGDQFEAQVLTRKVLQTNSDKILETICQLQQRLSSMALDESSGRNQERSRLVDDINTSMQCLEVCKKASDQVAHQKIHTVGEVVADHDTDQVVVTTLADLFDIRKVSAKDRSAQLVGSMADETLQKLSTDRYSSRFGTMSGGDFVHNISTTTLPSPIPKAHDDGVYVLNRPRNGSQAAGQENRSTRPLPNEVRKRTVDEGKIK